MNSYSLQALFLVLVSLGFQDRNLSFDDIGFGGLSGDPEVVGL